MTPHDPPPDRSEPRCGNLIHFPPARCTRPEGHAGDHETTEIPPQLSAAAAQMVAESDRFERLSAQMVEHLRERTHHLRVATYSFILATVVVTGVGIAFVSHLVIHG